MKIPTAFFLLGLQCLNTSRIQAAPNPELYWLQIKQIRLTEGEPNTKRAFEVIRSLEGTVQPGSPFYFRNVDNMSQAFVFGSLKERSKSDFTIQYTFDYDRLAGNSLSRHTIAGTVDLRIRKPMVLVPHALPLSNLRPNPEANTEYVLTMFPFVPWVGFRLYSDINVRLVDDRGAPVSNALVSLYFPDQDDCVIQPKRSNADGIVQIDEGRQDLPMLTLLGEQRNRNLYAEAQLDRTLSDENRDFVYVVKMNRRDAPPILLQRPDIEREFREMSELRR